MKICIINRSTAPEITLPVLTRIAEALVIQSARDLAGWYETAPDEFMVASSAPSGWDMLTIVDRLGVPDAVAYHDATAAGRPRLLVGVDMVRAQGGVFLDELSVAMSHEFVETRIDPYADWWADFDGKKMVALEACDPVQGDSYEIDGIKVASFVGPRWFRGGDGPWDYLSKLKAPLTMSPGGYLIFSDGTQQFGEKFPEHKQALVDTLGRRARARAWR